MGCLAQILLIVVLIPVTMFTFVNPSSLRLLKVSQWLPQSATITSMSDTNLSGIFSALCFVLPVYGILLYNSPNNYVHE